MDKPFIIKQARNLMLRSLDHAYPSGLTAKGLYQVMCTVNEGYGFDLMKKDIAYLRDKGYVILVGIGKKITLADVREDSLVAIKLTAAGLEIAQDLRDDPALEI